MFKYLWIILLGIQYIVWSYISIKDICKKYREEKKFELFIDCENYTLIWVCITEFFAVGFGIVSLIVFLKSIMV